APIAGPPTFTCTPPPPGPIPPPGGGWSGTWAAAKAAIASVAADRPARADVFVTIELCVLVVMALWSSARVERSIQSPPWRGDRGGRENRRPHQISSTSDMMSEELRCCKGVAAN